MYSLIKEPLFSFTVLGMLVFAAFEYRSPETPAIDNTIVVSRADINLLADNFEKKWLRSPDKTEIDHLIQKYIREEVLYREALELGMDENDSEIRRRLSQKMTFILEDISPLKEPTEQELQAFLDVHQEAYRQEPRFSFQHVYFDNSSDQARAQQEAVTLLDTLKEQPSINTPIGDPLMLASKYTLVTESQIKALLGSKFFDALRNLPNNDWHGPIQSSLGIHLVKLDNMRKGTAAMLDDVKVQVTRDWAIQEREKENDEIYERLREKYKVIVVEQEPPSMISNSASLVLNNKL